MIDEIMSMALGSGLWAALFCFLFLYMLKDSRNREKKYTGIIDSLSEHLTCISKALDICEQLREDMESAAATEAEIRNNTVIIKEEVEAIRASDRQ